MSFHKTDAVSKDSFPRGCITVDLSKFRSNMEQMYSRLAPGTKMIGVIKSDGYGHGAIPLAAELEQMEFVWGYAAAEAEEALALRREDIQKPILILGSTFPVFYRDLLAHEIRPTVFREDMLEELDHVAADLGIVAPIHIKVDTGMSRIGITPDDKGIGFVKKALSYKHILVEGVFTHFARADELDKTYVKRQFELFQKFTADIESQLGYRVPIRHCCNSAALIELPEYSMDLVRAGITIYGLWPSDEVNRELVPLKPILTLSSQLVYVKEVEAGTQISYGGTYVTPRKMRIGTVPLGYADGYPRGLSGKGFVLIAGKKVPIVGRVCMDQFMVDLSEIPGAKVGDPVTLIGEDGDLRITMEEVGDLSGRFNYELACLFGKRVPRLYVKDGIVIGYDSYY